MAWLGWTEENTAEVTRLWLKGDSAAEIAKAMGIPTRNTVIGKVNRLGLQRDLPSKPRAVARPRQPRPKPAAVAPLPKITAFAGGWNPAGSRLAPTPANKLRTVAVVVTPVSTAELKAHHCRWPLDLPGDPIGAERLFCGSPKAGGSSYCPGHSKLAFQAPYKTDPDKYAKKWAALVDLLDHRRARA